MRFLFVRPAFACGFLQIPPRDGHPCRPANDSPCRVRRRLSLPSECALPGAPKQTAADVDALKINGRGERIRTSDLTLPNRSCGKNVSSCLFESCSHQGIIEFLHSFPFVA